jgi:hypothetical protein
MGDIIKRNALSLLDDLDKTEIILNEVENTIWLSEEELISLGVLKERNEKDE